MLSFKYIIPIEMEDPATIPALVLVAEVNTDISQALAAFGHPAFSETINAAYGYDSGRAIECIIALRFMVEEWGLAYFNVSERAELKALVGAHLAVDQPVVQTERPTVDGPRRARQAAILALLLDDAEARGWVERLASDEAAFRKKLPGQESKWAKATMTSM